MGASRVVLAREVSLSEMADIRKRVDLELEVFGKHQDLWNKVFATMSKDQIEQTQNLPYDGGNMLYWNVIDERTSISFGFK